MALNDRQHVEAVGLLRMVVDQVHEFGGIVDPDLLRGAEKWLEGNHPEPKVYMAAMSSLVARWKERRMSRNEWMTKCDELADQFESVFKVDHDVALENAYAAMEKTCGPCPPNDPPKWHTSAYIGYGGSMCPLGVTVDDDGVLIRHGQLLPNGVRLHAEDAWGMAKALEACATWLRERQIVTVGESSS